MCLGMGLYPCLSENTAEGPVCITNIRAIIAIGHR